MPEELLQRMRDIHYPDAPGWFPPAPGWWILAALLIVAVVYLAWLLRARKKRKAPYKEAHKLLIDATERENTGKLATRDYLDVCNALLKRLLVHVRHNESAVSASGDQWLQALDELHGSNQFSQGPGKLLGDLRFAPSAPESAPGLHQLLSSFIKRLANRTEDSSKEVGQANGGGKR